MKALHAYSLTAVIAATAFWAGPLRAAEADAGGGAATSEIVVTARRRPEKLQDVPVSVSMVDQAELEAAGVRNFHDIATTLPGVQFTQRSNLSNQLTIRGIGGDSRNIGLESGVGMYLDGVYIPRTSGYNADLAEISRVEVLRGPQGTLYGKNTIGGVINVITLDPSDVPEGHFLASYGNHDAVRIQASLSGPLAKDLSARLTFAASGRDGYIKNLHGGDNLNNEDRRGVRLQLKYAPSDQLTVRFSADATRDRGNTLQSQPASPAGAAAPYYTSDRFTVNSDQPNRDWRDMAGASLTADYRFANGITLTSITGYREIDVDVASDIDTLPINLFASDPVTDFVQMASQEFRISSPSDRPLRYVAGLYYYYQRGKAKRNIFINGSLAAGAINRAVSDTNSYAAYANADYDILPTLTLNGGLRYTDERKTGSFLQIRGPLLSYNFPDLSLKDDNISWTGSLTWKPNQNLSAYVTVARGFKSGGFNLDTVGAANLVASDLVFGPESVTNYEAGLKGVLLDRRLRFTLAAFHLEYHDKQVSQLVSTAVSPAPSVQVTNAGRAKINGFEAEAHLQAAEGLTLSANATYLDAHYTQFNFSGAGATAVSYAGNRIEFTPTWMAGLQLDYRRPIGPGEAFFVGGLNYTGPMYLQPQALPFYHEGGYTLVDARLGYRKDRVTVALWGHNLGQTAYRTYARNFAGLDQAVWGEPRFYGVDVQYDF